MKDFIKKMSLGDVLFASVVLAGCSLLAYGCSLEDVKDNTGVVASAVSTTLDTAEPIVSAVESMPVYEGVNEEAASKVEHGLKTTTKNIEYVKAGLGIVKVAAPATAVYIEPAIKIIGGIGLMVTSLLGFVERRKRKKTEKIVGVVMKAVNPVKGVGGIIGQAAKNEGISDETHALYRKHVEA
jgi:hypothetical protein